MNYISSQLDTKVRIFGMSTPLANARDLADWLEIKDIGLYNFRHSVRPVPLEICIDGFSLNVCSYLSVSNPEHGSFSFPFLTAVP